MGTNSNAGSMDALPSFRQRFVRIWLAGATGVAVLAIQPPPVEVANIPELAGLHPLALSMALIINPLILLTLAAIVGAGLAPRAGLRSAIAGLRPATPAIGTALCLGFSLAAAMAVIDAQLAPRIGGSWAELVVQAPAPSLLLGVFYGAFTEEIMLRWGGLSAALCFCAWLAGGGDWQSRRTQQADWVAIVLVAAVFAAGHLPVLRMAFDLDLPIVVRTFLFNFVAGIGYGYLAWRHSLESAVIAHASTHVGLAVMRWTLY